MYVKCRTNSLTCDLHQAEFAEWQNVVPRPVRCHDFSHMVIQGLPVFGFGHVDEVHYDYAAHIAQSQLACYFVGCLEIHNARALGFLVD